MKIFRFHFILLLIILNGCSLFDDDENSEDRVWLIRNGEGEVVQEYEYGRDTVTRTFFFNPGQLYPQYRTHYLMEGGAISGYSYHYQDPLRGNEKFMDYLYSYENGRRSSEVGTDLERNAGFPDQNNAFSFQYQWDDEGRSYTLRRGQFFYEGELSEEGNIISRKQTYQITDLVENMSEYTYTSGTSFNAWFYGPLSIVEGRVNDYPDEVRRVNKRVTPEATLVDNWHSVNEFIKDEQGRVVEIVSNHNLRKTSDGALLSDSSFVWRQFVEYY